MTNEFIGRNHCTAQQWLQRNPQEAELRYRMEVEHQEREH